MFKYGHADYTYPRVHLINVLKVCESANKDCVKEPEMTKMGNSEDKIVFSFIFIQ